MQLVPDPPTLD